MISEMLQFIGRFYPFRRGRWTISRHCARFCRGPVVARLRCGKHMLLDRANAVDRVIYLFGEYDVGEMGWLVSKATGQQEPILYDIGANIGAYSVIMPAMVPGISVQAFEPDSRNVQFLKANIAMNWLGDIVTVHEIAVGEDSGVVSFLESRGGANLNTGKSKVSKDAEQPGGCRTVEKRSIDSLADHANRVVLVKIDVEGYEYEVLRGMKKTLKNNRCYLMIEIFAENLAKCDEFMASCGYERTKSFGSEDWGYEKCNS